MNVTRRKLYVTGAAVLAVGLAWRFLTGTPAAAQMKDQPPLTETVKSTEKDWDGFGYQKAASCMECHSKPSAARKESGALDFVLMIESGIWRTHDKHAQAFAVLEGPRGMKMAELLVGLDQAKYDALQDADKIKTWRDMGCLNCHGMDNLSGVNESKVAAEEKLKVRLDPREGVSCAGCHGPSIDKYTLAEKERPDGAKSGWLGDHQVKAWRNRSALSKYNAGMRNLRDPSVRAELCMSCHVGSAPEGRVVSHSMMAAGHPPLPPIEIASFSRNEPQHWRNTKDVKWINDNKNNANVAASYYTKYNDVSQSRFALIGNVVAVRETLKLAHDRANFADDSKPEFAWPELFIGAKPTNAKAQAEERWAEVALAHSDCYACHHDLKYPGYRQNRGFGYFIPGLDAARVTPGRPIVRSWPLAGLVAASAFTGKDLKTIQGDLNELARVTSARPFGNPTAMRDTIKKFVTNSDTLIAELETADFDRAKLLKISQALCDAYTAPGAGAPDYETARQIAGMLRVFASELGIKEQGDFGKIIETLKNDLDLEPYRKRADRLGVMEKVIWLGSKKNKADAGAPDAAFTKAFNEFKVYLDKVEKNEPLTADDLEKVESNGFLRAASESLSSKDFVEALKNKAIIKDLQDFSDEEQRLLLQSIASYDPQAFLAQLAALRTHLK